MKTKSCVRYNFLNIHIIFAARCTYLRARADTASINQALHPNSSHWKCLSLHDQCNDSCYNVRRLCNTVWSSLFGAGCVVERSGTDISHTFIFFNIIGLVQRIVRFVMRTEPKASYWMVQYEYAYLYTQSRSSLYALVTTDMRCVSKIYEWYYLSLSVPSSHSKERVIGFMIIGLHDYSSYCFILHKSRGWYAYILKQLICFVRYSPFNQALLLTRGIPSVTGGLESKVTKKGEEGC